ncbi:hypothetical protein B0T20DRAFT_439432 [Sordaria brevicollis]|uniref:SUZ domain-containing protein n=1 Tax=Sordaria brevicollis TaxID=83679 RepID=A0AAE0PDJ0_SORBR|nr:hypothetical protein B0T20DRAFT_439432 [Sordaria brevicollis]
MGKNDSVPDAWDDDWESLADRASKEEPSPEPEKEVKMTKAERLAMHAEAQRKLWEAAESEKEINFLAATSSVPLTTPFKPAMKVLSRRPVIAKRDPVTGLERLTLQDDEDDDVDKNKKQETPEEIRMRQQRELEEKQRRYEEARAKIFGEASPSSGPIGIATTGQITGEEEDAEACIVPTVDRKAKPAAYRSTHSQLPESYSTQTIRQSQAPTDRDGRERPPRA